MATKPVIKDPTHPDFPHGTDRGYGRGCGCGKCRTAHTKVTKVAKYRKLHNQEALVPVEPVREHLRRILDESGITCADVDRDLGLPMATTNRIMRRERATIHPDRASQYLAYTGTKKPTRDPMHYVTMLRRLQANGWSLRELSTRLGYSIHRLEDFVRRIETGDTGKKPIYPRTADRLDALFAEIGDLPGTSLRARRTALALGYYPSSCYDENGDLDLRSVPGHPWREGDEAAEQIIDALHILVDPTPGARSGSNRSRQIERIKSRLRIRQTYDPYREQTEPRDEHSKHMTATIRDLLYDYEHGDLDPVELVLTLGLSNGGPRSVGPMRFGGFPEDHPGVQSWLAKQADESDESDESDEHLLAA